MDYWDGISCIDPNFHTAQKGNWDKHGKFLSQVSGVGVLQGGVFAPVFIYHWSASLFSRVQVF